MSTRPEIPETVTVVCPTCGTPLHPRVKDDARKVRCPDCFVAVKVPSRAEVLLRLEKQRFREPEDPGTYQIVATLAGAPPVEEKAAQPTAPLAPSVLIVCPICQTRLHPEVHETAYAVRCHDCHEPVTVPALKDVPAAPPPKPPPRVGRYKAGEISERARLETNYLEVQAVIRREPADAPPRWTFFSDTYTFPWSAGAWTRWGFLSVGFTALQLLLAVAYMLASGGGPGGLAAAFFALPAIWVGLWTFSYAAACALAVVIDTAAGMDRIANWPEPAWREWMWEYFYVSLLGGLAVGLGYGAGVAADLLGGGRWIVWPLVTFVLFPVILLSSLEANSLFVPFTLPILRSMVSHWWGWAMFYLLSGTLLCGLLVLAAVLGSASPLLMPFAAGPLAAAVLLIAARLLGRLAWRASALPAKASAKRKRRKLAGMPLSDGDAG